VAADELGAAGAAAGEEDLRRLGVDLVELAAGGAEMERIEQRRRAPEAGDAERQLDRPDEGEPEGDEQQPVLPGEAEGRRGRGRPRGRIDGRGRPQMIGTADRAFPRERGAATIIARPRLPALYAGTMTRQATRAVRSRTAAQRWRRSPVPVGGLGLALAMALGGVWLVERDPTPRFLARRSRLVAAVVETSARTGADVVERVRLRSASGLGVELAIKRPLEDGTPRRRPLVVLLGGLETGRDAVDLVADTRGTVIAALSYPYRGATALHGPRVVLAVPAIRAAILDTPPAILLSLDHLLAQAYVDPRRVELVGVSLGAPFAIVAGALDPRCRRVWSVHGAGDLRRLLDAGLRGRIAAAPPRAALAALAYLCGAGPSVAPERWVGRIAPRPFVMVNGLDDERLPRRAILELYARAREPKELVWVPGPHVEPERRQVVERLLDRVLGRIAAGG